MENANAPARTVPTREGYDGWATIYDGEGNPLIALEEQHLPPLLGPLAGLDVIDVGCGTGRHASRLASEGARVTAVDFSSGMVAQARQKPGWEKVRFVEHDLARPLPFEPASFDRVLCCLVLDHIADLPLLFGEMRRVCRPGGWIAVSSVHPALMLRGIEAHYTDPRTGVEIRPQSVANSISDYVMAAVGAGLRIEHMSEHAIDAEMAARMPRAAKYEGWPLLLLMRLRVPGAG